MFGGEQLIWGLSLMTSPPHGGERSGKGQCVPRFRFTWSLWGQERQEECHLGVQQHLASGQGCRGKTVASGSGWSGHLCMPARSALGVFTQPRLGFLFLFKQQNKTKLAMFHQDCVFLVKRPDGHLGRGWSRSWACRLRAA